MITTLDEKSGLQQPTETEKLFRVVLENVTNATTIYDLKNEYLVLLSMLKISLYPLSTVTQVIMNDLEPEDPLYMILTRLDTIILKNTDNVFDQDTESFIEYILYLDTIYLINKKSFIVLRSKKAKREANILEETFKTISVILQEKNILLMLYRLYITLKLRSPLEHLRKAVQEDQDQAIISNLSTKVKKHIEILRYASKLGLKRTIPEKDFVMVKNSIIELVIMEVV